jgi:hypothetical protein
MNATETTETKIGSLIVPQGVKRIIGVTPYAHAKGLTTLETVSGIVTLKAGGMTGWIGDQTFPLPTQNPLTSGTGALNPYTYPVDIPVNPGATLDVYATMDMALTINPGIRVGIQYE